MTKSKMDYRQFRPTEAEMGRPPVCYSDDPVRTQPSAWPERRA